MNPPRRIFAVIMLSGTLLLTGCGILDYLAAPVMANRIDDMVALVNGHDVAFTLPEEELTDKDVKFWLNYIGVDTSDVCAKDCVVWEMVRTLDSNSDLIEENFVTFPIKYGVTLPNMQTRVYTELRKGRYTATASIAMIKHGKVINSKRVGAVFTIE